MEMPKSLSTPQDFIKQTFAPMIAVSTSSGVNECCRKNNLTLTELLKPFSLTTVDGNAKDVSGNVIQVKNLRINFCEIDSKPPPPQVARTHFNNAISSNIHDRTKSFKIGDAELDIPETVPWYEAWRSTFLQVQSPSDHEFTKHYVGCLIAISSIDPNQMDLVATMTEDVYNKIRNENSKLIKWLGNPNSILFTYLLLHDKSVSEEAKSIATLEAIGATYGSQNCFILGINSRKENSDGNSADPWLQYISTDISYKDDGQENEIEHGIEVGQDAGEKLSPSTPIHPLSPVTDEKMSVAAGNEPRIENKRRISQHGMCLTSEDINKIQKFVNDYLSKALTPFFEHGIHQLNEQVLNRKGVSRSLLSATKRWFGTSKPGAPGNHIPPSAITYSNDSHELQLRRLGDLCFMIGHYHMAFNAYHSAKRDFNADSAWLHYAGALEMAALSAFMTNSDSLARKVVDYFEESIATYQNACRLSQFATRATILSYECLKGKGLYGEAAKQLIRMTGEDSDLRSAVLLEQAAYCFLSSSTPFMHRKYAFHMVLAGNRYLKANHKNHLMRCYFHAYQVYNNKSWMIAEDHILYTIGKHATQLKLFKCAFDALSLLVTRSSPQSEQQQQLFLKDYLIAVQNVHSNGSSVLLNLPIMENHLTEIHLSISTDVSIRGEIPASCNQNTESSSSWYEMEDTLANYASVGKIMIFNPAVEILSSKSKDSVSASAVLGETVGVYMCLRNPLHIPIKLSGMQLTWDFTPESVKMNGNQQVLYATSNVTNDITLPEDSTRRELLTIVPNAVGTLRITGIEYILDDLHGSNVKGKQTLGNLYKRPKSSTADKRLELSIIEKAPRLKVSFQGLKSQVFCNEIFPVSVSLTNTGALSVSRILVMSSPNCKLWIKDCPVTHPVIFDIPLSKRLGTDENIEVTMYIQPSHKSQPNLELLFYYESERTTIKPRYRLVKHSWPISVTEAFRLTTITSISNAISETDALNIRLQIDSESLTRCSTIMKMQIESVSISSKKWKLGKYVIDPSVIMEEDQRLFLLIQALRRLKNSTEGPISTSYLLPDGPRDVPFPYFLPTDIVALSSDIDIICVVNWKLETISNEINYYARGQEHILLNNPLNTSHNSSVISPNTFPLFRDPSKPLEVTKLVSCRIHLPQRVRHKFVSKRLCTIPVILNLHNCSGNELSVKVSTSFTETAESHDPNHSSCFSWVGQTSFTKLIDRFGDVKLSLVAAVTTTGAYDFSSGLTVEVQVANKMVKQVCSFDSITVIY